MTPKEYAIKLFNKFNKIKHSVSTHVQKKRTIECCLIAVKEIESAIDWHEFETPNKEIEFWNKVKSEIEIL